jgi:hypothetical protein
MQARKLIARGGMVESGGGLKGVWVVAVETIGPELALMPILMTKGTFAAEPQKRAVRIFQLELGANIGGDPGRRVTFLAGLLAVLAEQSVSRLGEVIELRAIQRDESGSRPVVFLVATQAVGLAFRALEILPVKAGMRFHPAADFRMAFQALEITIARSKRVARPALRHTLQLLVGARQRAGGYLRERRNGAQESC